MNFSAAEVLSIGAALCGILLLGSTHLRVNVSLYILQISLLCGVSALYGHQRGEPELFLIAGALFLLKALAIPVFLSRIIQTVHVNRDKGTFLPAPIAMHVALGFLMVSYLLARELPPPAIGGAGWPDATASISLLCTGLLIMLTRRIALSQVIGFLVMENGIYLFGLTQTTDMPLLVEMGVLLDVLVGVMISGLIAFRIQKSFEHIDVTLLSELKD
jgi:hydrogenase-4 component E